MGQPARHLSRDDEFIMLNLALGDSRLERLGDFWNSGGEIVGRRGMDRFGSRSLLQEDGSREGQRDLDEDH